MSVTVKHGMDSFTAALKPGINQLVMNSFKAKLTEKMDGLVDEVYKEMADELPTQIEATIGSVLNESSRTHEVKVIVDLRNHTSNG